MRLLALTVYRRGALAALALACGCALAMPAAAVEPPAEGASFDEQVDHWLRKGYDWPDEAVAQLEKLRPLAATPAGARAAARQRERGQGAAPEHRQRQQPHAGTTTAATRAASVIVVGASAAAGPRSSVKATSPSRQACSRERPMASSWASSCACRLRTP